MVNLDEKRTDSVYWRVSSRVNFNAQPQSSDINSAMATTSTPSIPSDQYFKVVKYLVRKLKEETKVEGDVVVGVRWPIVREWFLDVVADQDRLSDEDYLAEQKILAANSVRRMSEVYNPCPSIYAQYGWLVQERVLRGEKRNGHSYWTVHPLCKVVDDMDETPANQRLNSLVGGRDSESDATEDGETIEVEAAPIADRNSEWLLPTIKQWTLTTNFSRKEHAEAYAEVG
jgi:hypothetical protein